MVCDAPFVFLTQALQTKHEGQPWVWEWQNEDGGRGRQWQSCTSWFKDLRRLAGDSDGSALLAALKRENKVRSKIWEFLTEATEGCTTEERYVEKTGLRTELRSRQRRRNQLESEGAPISTRREWCFRSQGYKEFQTGMLDNNWKAFSESAISWCVVPWVAVNEGEWGQEWKQHRWLLLKKARRRRMTGKSKGTTKRHRLLWKQWVGRRLADQVGWREDSQKLGRCEKAAHTSGKAEVHAKLQRPAGTCGKRVGPKGTRMGLKPEA